MAARIILYGCGNIGKEALDFFGEENVACFCDSKDDLIGKTVYGKEVISRSRLAEICGDYILLISTSINIAHEIADMLEAREIYDFLIYEMMKQDVLKELTAGEFISKYASPEKRSYLQRDYYRDKAQKLQYQLDYLKQHADITALKPATGYLRKKQRESVDFALEFFEFIKELDIKPFLISGSLIGAIRHGGFIPWDDDLDFGLIRSDYEKLISFCEQKCHVEIFDGSITNYTTDVHLARIDRVLQKYPNEYVLDVWIDQLQINRGTSSLDRIGIDFFSFDYYDDAYSFSSHSKYLQELTDKKKELDNAAEIIRFLRDEIDRNRNISREKTGHIYFGIDSVCGYYRMKMEQDWILAEDVFPLKKVPFENTQFYVPHNMKGFLKINYPDYMQFPKEFALDAHENYVEEYLEKNYICAEFYLIDAFEIYHFLPLYHALEGKGIHARFVAEPPEYNVSGKWFDYDTTVKLLESNEVRWGLEVNRDSDYAFTTQTAEILKKYNGKKVNMSYGFGLTNGSFSENCDTIEGFDLKLVHGDISYQLFQNLERDLKIIRIGYPKYNKALPVPYGTQSAVLNIHNRNEKDKPVLVYFPTWDKYSSIMWYGDELAKLKSKFFIVSKPHHCTSRLDTEKENLRKLREISDIVLDGNCSLEEAARIGDIALCDAISGAATEVPYVNQDIPLVLLYSPVPERNHYKDMIHEFSCCVTKPEELVRRVCETAAYDKCLDRRRELTEDIYGKYGESSLDELLEYILSKKKRAE